MFTLRDHASTVTGLTLTPDGKYAISASEDKTLKIWNLDATTEKLTVNGHMGAVAAIAITPDGQKAISASWDRTLKVWNLETGTEIHTLQGHIKPVQSLAVTPDRRQIISGSNDTKLKIWDLDSGREVATLHGHQLPIIAVAITPDGKYILSSSRYQSSGMLSSDKPLRMWDIYSRQEVNIPNHLMDRLMALLETHKGLYSPCSETGGYPNGGISAIAIMPNGKQILTAINAQDKPVIKIFDLATGYEVNTLRGHETPVTALALTPDGQYAISASFWDGKIKIWELNSCTEIDTLYCHNDFVNSVAITRDGRHLISTSKDTK